MRPGPNSRRTRGRSNNPGGGGGRRPNLPNRNQTFDSNGPDVRIRGNAYQVHEKYLGLARDAAASGDRIMAENYLQHAEHYYRIINAINEAYNQAQQQPFDNGRDNGGRDNGGRDQGGREFGARGEFAGRDNGQRVFDPRDEIGQDSDFGGDPRQSDERETRDNGANGAAASELLPGEAAAAGDGDGAPGERPARRRRNPGTRPRRPAGNGADPGEAAAEATAERDQPDLGS